jgi:uncharacterized protein
MSNQVAERRFTLVPVELRAKAEPARRVIGGYAALFERPSQNLGGFVEKINRSFFNKSRGDGWPDVMARYNHDDNMLLGTSGAGTLRLTVDETGLDYEVDPPQSRQDVFELVQRGDVRKSSFAFYAFEEEWGVTDQGFPLRTLLSGRLVDVAPVNVPAYADTSVGLRADARSVALRSLAAQVQAPIEEVVGAEDLRKFLIKTGGAPAPKPRTFGPAALMEILGKKEPAA